MITFKFRRGCRGFSLFSRLLVVNLFILICQGDGHRISYKESENKISEEDRIGKMILSTNQIVVST